MVVESPLLQELWAERGQKLVLDFLEGRFQSVPPDVAAGVRTISGQEKLGKLARAAGNCADLDTFRSVLAEVRK